MKKRNLFLSGLIAYTVIDLFVVSQVFLISGGYMTKADSLYRAMLMHPHITLIPAIFSYLGVLFAYTGQENGRPFMSGMIGLFNAAYWLQLTPVSGLGWSSILAFMPGIAAGLMMGSSYYFLSMWFETELESEQVDRTWSELERREREVERVRTDSESVRKKAEQMSTVLEQDRNKLESDRNHLRTMQEELGTMPERYGIAVSEFVACQGWTQNPDSVKKRIRQERKKGNEFLVDCLEYHLNKIQK